MKMMCLAVLVLCTVVLLSGSVSGYSIYPTSEESVKVINIHGEHTITNGHLESKLLMRFDVTSDVARRIIIHFRPSEHIDYAPIRGISFYLCEGYSYDTRPYTGYSGTCDKYEPEILNYSYERPFVSEGIVSMRNYTWYAIDFSLKGADEHQRFVLLINYTMPNFVFENGDYSVAWLTLPDMNNKGFNISNTIILPSEDDIPRFFENAEKINRYAYNENGKWMYRWAFTYLGGDDITLWYWNDQKIKERERNNLLFGVFLGFVLTQLHLFWRMEYLKKLVVWFVGKFRLRSVIGNSKNKKYHGSHCGYVKRIHEKNKMKFRTRSVAEKNGYKPCGVCCIDK